MPFNYTKHAMSSRSYYFVHKSSVTEQERPSSENDLSTQMIGVRARRGVIKLLVEAMKVPLQRIFATVIFKTFINGEAGLAEADNTLIRLTLERD